MSDLDPCEFRACPSSYVVFLIIFGGQIGLCAFVAIAKQESSFWWLVGLLAVVLAFVLFWLSCFRLVFAAESVTYASLFTRRRTIHRSEIAAADFAEHTGPLESPVTFVILTFGGEELRINAKVFSLAAVDRLVNLLKDPP